jgi:hypothetical protein
MQDETNKSNSINQSIKLTNYLHCDRVVGCARQHGPSNAYILHSDAVICDFISQDLARDIFMREEEVDSTFPLN